MGTGVDPYEKYREMHAVLDIVESFIYGEMVQEYGAKFTQWNSNPWNVIREGDTWEVPEVGTVTCVEERTDYSREGDFENWSQPIWIVLEANGRWFQIIGKNISHQGNDFDYPVIREVTPQQKTITEWKEMTYGNVES